MVETFPEEPIITAHIIPFYAVTPHLTRHELYATSTVSVAHYKVDVHCTAYTQGS